MRTSERATRHRVRSGNAELRRERECPDRLAIPDSGQTGDVRTAVVIGGCWAVLKIVASALQPGQVCNEPPLPPGCAGQSAAALLHHTYCCSCCKLSCSSVHTAVSVSPSTVCVSQQSSKSVKTTNDRPRPFHGELLIVQDSSSLLLPIINLMFRFHFIISTSKSLTCLFPSGCFFFCVSFNWHFLSGYDQFVQFVHVNDSLSMHPKFSISVPQGPLYSLFIFAFYSLPLPPIR